ncbi:MAG: MotA/TolQ/ExbB proton channel family protein [Pseudomonadales bacterium]|nr:MotA/TolQ/ExbB proton channel family protein [Pseudomonadales bacterium]
MPHKPITGIEQNLTLRALILCGVILFGFYLLEQQGYLSQALASDSSYISYFIISLYGFFSLHWLYLTKILTSAQKHIEQTHQLLLTVASGDILSRQGLIIINGTTIQPGIVADYVQDLLTKARQLSHNHADNSVDFIRLDQDILLEALSERLLATHAIGHFATDLLLKLGLVGTMVGFIIMLTPVAELKDYDPQVLQQLLAQMSGGMAVALFTTLAGLVTSTLLALQYQLLGTAATGFVDRLAVTVDILLIPLLNTKQWPADNAEHSTEKDSSEKDSTETSYI